MSDAEVRLAMFDAREELMATIQNELSERKIDFSELKEGDEARV